MARVQGVIATCGQAGGQYGGLPDDRVTADEIGEGEPDAVAARHGLRLHSLDPLLPPAAPLAASSSARLLSAGSATSRGLALASRRHLSTDDPQAMWGPAYRHELRVQLAGGHLVSPLDSLLGCWALQITADASSSTADSGATLDWPSRDTQPVPALLRHGLVPVMIPAARPAGSAAPAGPSPDVRLRRATPADVDAAASLRLAALRYDMQFGLSPERPAAARYARDTAERDLAAEDPWTWFALDGGATLGMVSVQPPQRARWVASMVRPGLSVGYVGVLSVVPAARGAGVGRALMAKAHAELDGHGVDVTLLHHRLLNPRSTPFWNSHGYRPLWATWWAQPASRLR
jgi:GNAT superfamily N-acetyltransferase